MNCANCGCKRRHGHPDSDRHRDNYCQRCRNNEACRVVFCKWCGTEDCTTHGMSMTIVRDRNDIDSPTTEIDEGIIEHPCQHCGVDVHSPAGQKAHDQEYKRYCSTHNMCHRSWHGHVRAFEHTQCAIRGCPNKPRFGTNEEFLRHFNRSHAGSGGQVSSAYDDDYNAHDGYDSDYAK